MVILHREQIRAGIKVAAYGLREGPAQGNRSFRCYFLEENMAVTHIQGTLR